MTRTDLQSLVAEVQLLQSELNNVEVKSARSGTPKRLFECLSAFANRTGGGVILFGLDEETDFKVVGVADAHRLQEDITSLASADMEPALRPEFTIDEIDGNTDRCQACLLFAQKVDRPGKIETQGQRTMAKL